MTPTKIRPRFVVLEAMCWNPDSHEEAAALLTWLDDHGVDPYTDVWSDNRTVVVLNTATLDVATPGEWVVRGVTGKFFAVSDEDYRTNYAEVA